MRPPGERLAITLRYFATGDSQASLSFAFRRGRSTITNILRETCGEIERSEKNKQAGTDHIRHRLHHLPGCLLVSRTVGVLLGQEH